MALVLDSGGLLAYDHGHRRVAALVRAAQELQVVVKTSSGCVAQTWRGDGSRQALLARLLKGVDESPLDKAISRQAGALCGRTGTSDVVDAHIALLTSDSDTVLSSDPPDIARLLRTLKVNAIVERC